MSIIWIVGGFVITAGLTLLVFSWIIPEDPAIQKAREEQRKQTEKEERERVSAWQQLSEKERERILTEESERVPKEGLE